MSHPIISPSVEAAGGIGGYDFRHLSDIRNFTNAAPESISSLAQAYNAVANRLADTPASGSVAEVYSQIAAGLATLADAAAEAPALLQTANQEDFNRIDNPRPQETMADHGTNTAGM
jgi:hypothetical protein